MISTAGHKNQPKLKTLKTLLLIRMAESPEKNAQEILGTTLPLLHTEILTKLKTKQIYYL